MHPACAAQLAASKVELEMFNKQRGRCISITWERETSSLCLCDNSPCTVLVFQSLVSICFSCLCSAEIDQKLQEIMKQTGYLKIDGQVPDADFSLFFMSLPVITWFRLFRLDEWLNVSCTWGRACWFFPLRKRGSDASLSWRFASSARSDIQLRWRTWSMRGRSAVAPVGRSSKCVSRRRAMSSRSK